MLRNTEMCGIDAREGPPVVGALFSVDPAERASDRVEGRPLTETAHSVNVLDDDELRQGVCGDVDELPDGACARIPHAARAPRYPAGRLRKRLTWRPSGEDGGLTRGQFRLSEYLGRREFEDVSRLSQGPVGPIRGKCRARSFVDLDAKRHLKASML
jgi:hypothetical protein